MYNKVIGYYIVAAKKQLRSSHRATSPRIHPRNKDSEVWGINNLLRGAVPNRDSTWEEGKFEDISTGRDVVKYHIMRSSCLRWRESHILREIHPIKVMGGRMHENLSLTLPTHRK